MTPGVIHRIHWSCFSIFCQTPYIHSAEAYLFFYLCCWYHVCNSLRLLQLPLENILQPLDASILKATSHPRLLHMATESVCPSNYQISCHYSFPWLHSPVLCLRDIHYTTHLYLLQVPKGAAYWVQIAIQSQAPDLLWIVEWDSWGMSSSVCSQARPKVTPHRCRQQVMAGFNQAELLPLFWG